MHNKKLNRLILLCSELRQKHYPNATSFVNLINTLAENDPRYSSISEKTFHRDKDELINDFGAPIRYNAKERGFELIHGGWEFEIPWLDQPEIVDVALAGKIASDILPAPVKDRVTALRDQIISRNTDSFFDSALLDSFIINWGKQKSLNQEIFNKLFEAWQKRQRIEFLYHKPTGEQLIYKIEPHVLTFNNHTWYIVGKKLPGKDRRTFAIQRVQEVTLMPTCFENDKTFVAEVKENGPYYIPDLHNMEVIYSGSAVTYALETYEEGQVEKLSADSVKVTIPEIRAYDLVNHILSYRGEAEALNEDVMGEVHAVCRKLLKTANK